MGEPRRAEGSGGWKGVAGERERERAGHILRRKQALAASLSNQRRVCSATGDRGGGSSNPRDQQAGRESQCQGRRKSCRRMPELRGGCWDQRKGCQGGSDSEASPRSIATFQNKNWKRGGRPGPAGHRSRRWMMCSQGRSQAEEGTSWRVTSEWHQVESMWGLAGAGLSGGPCRPSKVGSGRWPIQNMAKTAASAGAACRYHC
jgi:hypothetical protein